MLLAPANMGNKYILLFSIGSALTSVFCLQISEEPERHLVGSDAPLMEINQFV